MQQAIINGVILISVIFLILGIAFFLVLTKFYKNKNENTRRVFEAVIIAQEKERQRIAQDIHDELGSLLTSLGIYAANLSSSNYSEDEKLEFYKEFITLIDMAKKEAKNASNALMPDSIKKFGLKGAINEVETRFAHIEGLKFEIEYECNVHLSQFVQLQLYRIIIELVTNAVKYSSAKRIYIDFFVKDGTLTIQIKDDGNGFDIDKILKNNKANGLYYIFNRVQTLNGVSRYHSKPGEGSVFIFVFELKKFLQ